MVGCLIAPRPFCTNSLYFIDGVLRFMTGDVTTRNKMLKLIPHIDSGNWVVRQAVGTKPVITGKVGSWADLILFGLV